MARVSLSYSSAKEHSYGEEQRVDMQAVSTQFSTFYMANGAATLAFVFVTFSRATLAASLTIGLLWLFVALLFLCVGMNARAKTRARLIAQLGADVYRDHVETADNVLQTALSNRASTAAIALAYVALFVATVIVGVVLPRAA